MIKMGPQSCLDIREGFLQGVTPKCSLYHLSHQGSPSTELVEVAKAHGVHPAVICLKWAVQRGQIPIPFSIYENEYVSNLESTVKDPLTDAEMEILKGVDRNCRLIKGQVFLWPGATSWHDLWDEDGVIVK